jgi:hypothetical protein
LDKLGVWSRAPAIVFDARYPSSGPNTLKK